MQRNPYESPRAQSDVNRVGGRDVRVILVVCVYLLFALNGMVQATRPVSAGLGLLIWALTATMTSYWCVLDARRLNCPIVQSLHWIMFCAWSVAVPLYLVYSRRLRGLGIAIVHAVGLLIVLDLAFVFARHVARQYPG